MMKHQKNNKPAKRMPGLYLLLILFLSIGCMVAAAGTAFARYRSESQEKILFEVREPDQVYLGTVKEVKAKEKFAPSKTLEWTVDEKTGVASLTFAAANGTDSENYSAKTQAVKLRMLGSLNLAATGMPPELSVTYVSKKLNGDEEEKTVKGEISYLVEGTALYHTYGPGFIYTFYETTAEGKKELTWELPGGQLSHVTLTIKTSGTVSEVLGPLQPLITAETIEN